MTDRQRPSWAARLQAEREARGWSKHEMARQLMRADGLKRGSVINLARQVFDWEKGKHFPRDWAQAYARAFGMDYARLFPAAIAPPDQNFRSALTELPTVNLEETGTVNDWDDMERRRLLLAALGLGAGALGSSSESVRQLLDLALESEMRPIEDWQLACVDQLHALRTRPPAQVRDGLAIDLLALQRQLKTAGAGDRPELHRVVAALSTLHANILTRLGDHGAAIHWWRTARTAADASEDLNVRMMVRCEEAGFGLYGQRDPHTVLRLVESTRNIIGDSPSFWLADLAGTEAKALTLLGRHDDAKQSLRTFVGWDGGDARMGIFPTLWSFSQVHFAESWVYAAAGDEAEADRAREHVLSSTRDYQYAANVRLHEAMCTVVNGGIDQGARQAATVLDTLPAAYRSHMITETGRAVLRAVPPVQQQRPAVREFHEVLAKTAPKPTLPLQT